MAYFGLFKFFYAIYYYISGLIEKLQLPSLTLDIEYDIDYQLIGVISNVKEVKIAWFIGRVLELNFEKKEDLVFHLPGNKQLLISNFIVEAEYFTFRLLKNKAYKANGISKPYLLPEVKNYDYLIQLEGEYSLLTVEDIKAALREDAVVQYADIIDVDSLKSKENLIY